MCYSIVSNASRTLASCCRQSVISDQWRPMFSTWAPASRYATTSISWKCIWNSIVATTLTKNIWSIDGKICAIICPDAIVDPQWFCWLFSTIFQNSSSHSSRVRSRWTTHSCWVLIITIWDASAYRYYRQDNIDSLVLSPLAKREVSWPSIQSISPYLIIECGNENIFDEYELQGRNFEARLFSLLRVELMQCKIMLNKATNNLMTSWLQHLLVRTRSWAIIDDYHRLECWLGSLIPVS